MADSKSFQCECGTLVGIDPNPEHDQKFYFCQVCGRSYYRWSKNEMRPLGPRIPIKMTYQKG